jgi:hypothetical protein
VYTRFIRAVKKRPRHLTSELKSVKALIPIKKVQTFFLHHSRVETNEPTSFALGPTSKGSIMSLSCLPDQIDKGMTHASRRSRNQKHKESRSTNRRPHKMRVLQCLIGTAQRGAPQMRSWMQSTHACMIQPCLQGQTFVEHSMSTHVVQ